MATGLESIFAQQRKALESQVEKGIGRARSRFLAPRAGLSSFGSPVQQFGLGQIEESGLGALSQGLAQIGNLELQFRLQEQQFQRQDELRKAQERRGRLGGILGFGGGFLGAGLGAILGGGSKGALFGFEQGQQVGQTVGGFQ